MPRSDFKTEGTIFNIQNFSVHDGPGIRTIVFLKGCPFRCPWCSNPESQKATPELSFNRQKCLGAETCGQCIKVCPDGDRIPTSGYIEHDTCLGCHQCIDVCPSHARAILGKQVTVADVLTQVEQDDSFYARSGGGLTLSGGEPLFQPAFSRALLKEAKRRWIDTCMETTGFSSWTDFEGCCHYLDGLLFDIKTMDEKKHTSVIKGANTPILSNYIKLREKFPELKVRVRTPVIPGFNDTEKDIQAIIDFIQEQNSVGVEYELLPYHFFGRGKYDNLGRQYPMKDVQADKKVLGKLNRLIPESLSIPVAQGKK